MSVLKTDTNKILSSSSNKIRVGVKMPEEVAGLSLDWKAESLNLSNNNNVLIWTDSINNKILEVLRAGAPYNVFKTNKMNGYPSIQFNAVFKNADDIMNVLDGDFTLFIIVRKGLGLTGNILSGIESGDNGGFDFYITIVLRYREYNAGTVAFNINNSNLTTVDNAYNICVVNMKRGGACYARTKINNRTLVSNNSPSVFSPTASKMSILSNYITDSEREYPHLLMYNRALTEQEENAVYRGLLLKYKI